MEIGNIYSTSLVSLIPVVVYSNADVQKKQIFGDNKGKCGTVELINCQEKVPEGSGVNLSDRFYHYFSHR